MSVDAKSFGPTALATPANALTALRLVIAPLFAALVVEIGPSSWLLWLLWTALASSDGIDGLLARRHGTTRSGAFLDPLADKFLVLGALSALAGISVISWIPVAIIGAREIAMSVFRVYASRHGVSVPARRSAKLKTLVQDFAVAAAFLPLVAAHHLSVCRNMLWVAVALTIYTGAEYFFDARKTLSGIAVTDRLDQRPTSPTKG